MQYVDHATQKYAIAGTAAMGAAYVGGFAASAFFQPFVVGAAGPMMPSMGILAAGYGIGGAAGGAIGSGGSLLAGHQAHLDRAILAGAVGGALGGLGGLYGDPFTDIAGRGLAGGATSAIMGGKFERGVAFARVAAMGRVIYNGVVGYDINMGPGGDAQTKAPGQDVVEHGNNWGNSTSDPRLLGAGAYEGGATVQSNEYGFWSECRSWISRQLDWYLGAKWNTARL